MYGEYCYYIKGEGKDRVRGNETSIYPEFLKTGTNIGVGNLPLNGVISDNRTYPGKTAGVLSGTKRAPELMNMDLGAISARQSAPTDGRDEFTNSAGKGFYTSKQNSDATGMKYQWGLKIMFTFATSSEQWGTSGWERGKYPVKIYTIDGVLIYQDDKRGDNKDKQPAGGVIFSSTIATSMMETIKNPITFYYGGNNAMINQSGKTRDLWDYYWTSHSRGMDGGWFSTVQNYDWHNDYLDGYTPQRQKSIYDPCPFGFRIPSSGTYNDLKANLGWIFHSYAGGFVWGDNSKSWIAPSGRQCVLYEEVGNEGYFWVATPFNKFCGYNLYTNSGKVARSGYNYPKSYGTSVRCIEDCDPQSDDFAVSTCHGTRLKKLYKRLSTVGKCKSQQKGFCKYQKPLIVL